MIPPTPQQAASAAATKKDPSLMLEKMARAIEDANLSLSLKTTGPEGYQILAKAALQSLKDLDEGTIEAMEDELWSRCDWWDGPNTEDTKRAFTTAIDHILKAGEP